MMKPNYPAIFISWAAAIAVVTVFYITVELPMEASFLKGDLKEALRLNSQYVPALYNTALLYRQQGDVRASREYYSRGFRASTQGGEQMTLRGMVFLIRLPVSPRLREYNARVADHYLLTHLRRWGWAQ